MREASLLSKYNQSMTRGRRRLRLGCAGTLVFCIAVTGAVYALLAPWSFHMGGRLTPLASWSGFGMLRSSTGRQYPIYVYFGPRFRRHFHLTRGPVPSAGLGGSAWICPSPGVAQNMNVSGDIYNAWSTTEGSRVELGFREPILFNTGQRRRLSFSLSGTWHGPCLVLADRGAWARGVLRSPGAETASITFRWGSYTEFTSACQALK